MTHAQRLALVFMLFAWSAIFGLTCSGCGDTLADPYCEAPTAGGTAYITNGTPSTDRRSTVYLQGRGGYCSGTIIGLHTVLTAAHCAGVTDILVEGVAWFDVNQTIVHPDYSFPSNDLAILHSLSVLPEPYAPLATADIECTKTIAQGYGWHNDTPEDLNEREVFEATHIDDQIFNSSAIAPGDSGGPLWAITDTGPVLLGVASWGWGEADADYEGGTGHISVVYHNEWITGEIR